MEYTYGYIGNPQSLPLTDQIRINQLGNDISRKDNIALESLTGIKEVHKVYDEVHASPTVIARHGSTVVGTASFTIGQEGNVYIFGVSVDVLHRKRGIAKRLMEELLKRIEATNPPRVSLDCRIDNAAAKALYKSLGFVPVEQLHILSKK